LQQAEQLLRSGNTEFDGGNFGGAVYLATQAKRVATVGRGRLADAGSGAGRRGETAFSVPVPLVTTGRANLRSGPGTSFEVVATVEAATRLTGHASSQEWLRVTLADGRSAWVHQGLVRGAPGRP
jgi:SH3-like domain-containing protein